MRPNVHHGRNRLPELPEVETVRRGLLPAMDNAVISKADVRRPDLRWPFPKNMAERLSGSKILQLRRRSKYILADLASEETLLIHLGMSGRMLVENRSLSELHHDRAVPTKHDHVVFHMENGMTVTFNDARRFGAMDLFPTHEQHSHWLLKDIGPEPLGNAFDANYLAEQLSRRSSTIKSVLLDQRVVAGLGNIYVCEVLHRTGISPRRNANRISKTRVETLVPAIREVLTEAIDAGGSSLRDHRQANGDLGYFQHAFSVYGREQNACIRPQCGGSIARIVQSGRSSFYCPQCQR